MELGEVHAAILPELDHRHKKKSSFGVSRFVVGICSQNYNLSRLFESFVGNVLSSWNSINACEYVEILV